MSSGAAPASSLVAFGDEAFHEHPVHGFYVLASVVFDAGTGEKAREALRSLRKPRSTAKLHWYGMDRLQQHRVAKQLADFDGLHVVVTGAPVPRRRPERARAKCLSALIHELYGYGVEKLILGSARDRTQPGRHPHDGRSAAT